MGPIDGSVTRACQEASTVLVNAASSSSLVGPSSPVANAVGPGDAVLWAAILTTAARRPFRALGVAFLGCVFFDPPGSEGGWSPHGGLAPQGPPESRERLIETAILGLVLLLERGGCCQPSRYLPACWKVFITSPVASSPLPVRRVWPASGDATECSRLRGICPVRCAWHWRQGV